MEVVHVLTQQIFARTEKDNKTEAKYPFLKLSSENERRKWNYETMTSMTLYETMTWLMERSKKRSQLGQSNFQAKKWEIVQKFDSELKKKTHKKVAEKTEAG